MRGDYYMVVNFRVSILKMEQDAAGIIVSYGLDWRIKKQMIRGEASHDGRDITISTVLESTPLRAAIQGRQDAVCPPILVSQLAIAARNETHINRTRVTAGSSSGQSSGLELHAAAALGIK